MSLKKKLIREVDRNLNFYINYGSNTSALEIYISSEETDAPKYVDNNN